MSNNIDLKAEFEKYFNEQEGFGLRSERFFADVELTQPERNKLLIQWIEAAFIQGARIMAQDTIDTLRDYGTAVVAFDDLTYSCTQGFDMSADNLMTYYTQVLQNSELK
jgi:hypothetical protein